MTPETLADVTRAIREELIEALEGGRRLANVLAAFDEQRDQLAQALARLEEVKSATKILADFVLAAVAEGRADDCQIGFALELSEWRAIVNACGGGAS